MDRLSFRRAYRLDSALLQEYYGAPPTRPGRSGAGRVLVALSVLMMLVALAFVAGAVVLFVRGTTFVVWLAAVLMLLIAVLIRPRLGREPRRADRLERAQAPALYELLDQIAEAVGTRSPDFVVRVSDDNAAVTQVGFRRRRTLYLGMSLWVTSGPAVRVAVLLHEFAHFVNGDPNRDLLVQPVLTTFDRFASWTGYGGSARTIERGPRQAVLPKLLIATVSWLAMIVHAAITTVGFREQQRAEVLADAIAARVGGSPASVQAQRRLAISDQVLRLVRQAADSLPPAQWRRLVERYEETNAEEIDLLMQLGRRQVGMWDTHPPAEIRRSLMASWAEPGEVDLSGVDWGRVDAPLAPWTSKLHERLLGTREYRG